MKQFDRRTVDPNELAQQSELITLSAVARQLCLSEPTVYAYLRSGDFPSPVPLPSRCKMFYKRDIERWLADRKQGKPLPSYAKRESQGERPKHRGVLTRFLSQAMLMRVSEVEQVTRSAQPTIQGWIRAGRFPRPLSPGVWAREQVEQWVRDRLAGKPLPFSQIIPQQWALSDDIPLMRITSPEFYKMTRLEPVYVYRLLHTGDFPQPVARGSYKRREVEQWVRDRQAGKPLPGTGRVLPVWWHEHCLATPPLDRAQQAIQGRTKRRPGSPVSSQTEWLDPAGIRSMLCQAAFRAERERRAIDPHDAPALLALQRAIERDWTPDWSPEHKKLHDRMMWEYEHQCPYGSVDRAAKATDSPPIASIRADDSPVTPPEYERGREQQAVADSPVEWFQLPRKLVDLANEHQRETGQPHEHATEPFVPKPPVERTSSDDFGLDDFA